MKGISLIAVAAVLAATSASAADINGKRERSLDLPEPQHGPRSDFVNHSGFYINGALGVSRTERSLNGSIGGEKYRVDVLDEVTDAPIKGDLIVDHVLPFGGSEDVEGVTFGGGASYMFHMPASRLGIEIGVDGTVYNDNESSLSFTGNPIDYPGTGAEAASLDTTTGSAKFKRDFDLDLVAKGHYFVTSNWSLFAGGGLSWARASAEGGHSNSNASYPAGDPIYANAYDDDDDSFGYVLVAGTRVYVTDRVTFDLEYGFKKHDFDFGSSSSAYSENASGGAYGAIRDSHDRLKVEDETHTIKAKIGWKLGGVE